MGCIIEKLYLLLYQTVFSIGEVLGKCKGGVYIRCEMTPTSVGGEQQISISGGVNLPSDIASGRAHIVRWTMVLRRPKRSVDLQRCAVEVCHAIA